MSTLTHPLQHISGKDPDRRLRLRRHCQHWRQNNHQSPLAGDINGVAGEEELTTLVERLDKASTAYDIEISAEKTKLMTNNTEEEVGRQHQGMDRPGVRQVAEGSGELEKNGGNWL